MQSWLSNDAVLFGILAAILGAVFHTSSSDHPAWRRFYSIVPSLLLCYFLPSLLSTFGLVNAEESKLYFVASRYLLPTSLVLLTLSIDLKSVIGLGPKALIMFLTGTAGIVIGGPVALLLVGLIAPGAVGGDEVWRGLSTVAGSWIGGGANQAAMLEVFKAPEASFGAFVAVDVIVANIWMAVLLIAAGRSNSIDASVGADASSIDRLRDKVERYQAENTRIPTLPDLMRLLAVGFAVTGVSHFASDRIVPVVDGLAQRPGLDFLSKMSLTSGFFWLVVVATTLGVAMSFTPARRLEGIGASRIGSVFIYILVATIGMKMDLRAVTEHPTLFLVGLIWISIHAGLLIGVGRLIRAPLFFLAVGSQANVGGAASAPVVASAFHPALAPVGVLLAVVGYALGTYAAYICGLLLQAVAPGA